MDTERRPIGTIDYANTKEGRRRSAPRWATLILVTGMVALAVSILLPTRSRPREPAQRVRCAAKLRQIGQACLLYARENDGVYPDSFSAILRTEVIGSQDLICTNDTLEGAPGTTQQAAELVRTQPQKYVSFVYLGSGLTEATMTPQMVIAYEPLHLHDNDGANVLFGDGMVEFLTKAEAERVIAAGRR